MNSNFASGALLSVALTLCACSSSDDDATATTPGSSAAPTDAGDSGDGSAGDGTDTTPPGTRPSEDDVTGGGSADSGSGGSSSGLPAITLDNRVQLLGAVFDAYSGNAYAPRVLTLPDYSDVDYALYRSPGVDSETVTCSNGGTADLSSSASGDRVVTTVTGFRFDDCQDDVDLLDGELERTTSDTVGFASSGLTIENQSETLRYSGDASFSRGNLYGGSNQSWWSTSGLSFAIDDGIAAYELSDATSFFSTTVPFERTMSGGFTLTSAETGGVPITANVTDEFRFSVRPEGENWDRRDDPRFTTGTLELSAPDGSRLVLDADNGDFDTVDITVTDGDGSETVTDRWDQWPNRLDIRFDLPGTID